MKKYFAIPAYYFCSAILFEIISFLVLGLGFLPKYFIFDLSIMMIFASIVLICRNNLAQLIVASILLTVQLVLSYVNYTLLIQFGDILSLEMLMLITAAKNAMSNDFLSIWIMLAGIGILMVDIFGATIVYLKVRNIAPNRNRHFAFILVGLMLCTQVGSFAIYKAQKEYLYAMSDITATDYIESDTFLLDSTLLKRKSIQTLGTFGFYANNIALAWFGDARYEEALQTLALSTFRSTKDQTMTQSVTDNDQNIIVIMTESLDTYALSNELTPNLWSLMNVTDSTSARADYDFDSDDTSTLATYDDLVLDNVDSNTILTYYSKNKTNISEDVSLLGSYPIMTNLQNVAGESYDTSLDSFGFGLPELLNEQGYITTYLHSYTSGFYNRKHVIKNIGFQNQYFADEEYEDYGFFDWRREVDFVNTHIDHIIPSTTDPFFTFYTTVGMHGNYNNSDTNLDQRENIERVRASAHYNYLVNKRQGLGTEMYNHLANYLASVVGFDNALGEIISSLKTKGIYDETAIIVFGDHNAYYHNLTYAMKDVVINDYGNYWVNTIPWIIKSSANSTHTLSDITSLVSTNDMLPTVMDILGVPLYNENLYLGDSVYNYTNGVNVPRVNFSYTGGVASTDYFTLDLVNFDEQPNCNSDNLGVFKTLAKDMLRKIFILNTLYKNAIYAEI
ncbi:MAG: sulfatase-like hydrolase/transferase [Clostridia bacterium]|nr:sulfatase-like hydrolase/transferase [Clostridia bacterium]